MPLNYKIVGATLLSLIQFSCGTSPVDVNRTDTTPTSGTLNVYYEAGLEKLVQNQAYTFQALYERAHLKLCSSTENQAIQALYNDSCESIIIT